ncbi:peptidase [Bacillus canaveralius]|uniref:Peptidase n=1 Tax=Bacillus canaveralius TaxID=1403243 RepID=A0A2N5GIT2_9BACI|nr:MULTISPECIES: C40 family peptidase [Bacillus]PLR80929.1 peptidase [Bacillus canaveralius]PLR81691.1 peptidase [Bacillus sp. V33-4]PLR91217.1 peptidase [Bacillus canaveralius]RSK52681.1 peptidase [Bacillus canaveralius]
MKKRLLVLNTTVMIGLGSTFAIPNANAESINSLQNQRTEIKASISQAEQALAAAQVEIANLNEQIKRIDQAIEDNNHMIVKTEADIIAAQAEIQKLEEEIAILQERIAKRNEVLKDRALSFQESGGNVGYIEVLLGSSSFSDFVDRVDAVSKIVEADQTLLEQHDLDKKDLETKQGTVQTKLTDLNNQKIELEGMKAQILEQKQENDRLKAEVEQKEKDNAATLADLQSQDSQIASRITAIQQAIEQEQRAAAAAVQKNAVAASFPASERKASGSINDVITAGYKYIGNSAYRFGGGRNASDIANGYFDCSGFVHWAFAQAGIRVGASTDQLKNAGTQIPTSQMQPGDLVFFNTYKTDGHVGIYIGGGKFIGSQDSTGVAIADMSSGYWQGHFNGRVVRVQ